MTVVKFVKIDKSTWVNPETVTHIKQVGTNLFSVIHFVGGEKITVDDSADNLAQSMVPGGKITNPENL